MRSFILNENEMNEMAKRQPTPFLVLSVDRVAENYAFLRKHLPRAGIYYAIKANRVQAERFNCQIEVEYPEKIAKLFVDSEKIAWVVTNLLSNAIRYSSENGRIIIGARQIDKAVEIYVKDFGKGIDSRYHESIFDHYFRVPGTKVQGSGLGLAISKDFVEAHGGTIRIESEVGKGSTFVIRFNV